LDREKKENLHATLPLIKLFLFKDPAYHIHRLASAKWEHRLRAAKALGELRDARATGALTDVLRRWLAAGTQAGLVEEAVVEALGKIADKRAIPVLIAILEANYDYKCSSASGDLMRHHSKFVGIVVECLGKIGDRAALEPIVRLMPRAVYHFGGPFHEMGGAFLAAIGRFGLDDARLFAFACACAEGHNSYYVREQAAVLLGDFGDLRAINSLFNSVETVSSAYAADPIHVNAVLCALRKLGVNDEAIAIRMFRSSPSGDPWQTKLVTRVLQSVDPTGLLRRNSSVLIDRLVEQLADPARGQREYAAN